MIEIIPCGPLAKKYPSIKIAAHSAADAIEGWSQQVSGGHRMKDIVEAVDFDTEEKLRAPTEVSQVKLYPTMFGGGGKFLGIIIGAVQVVAGIILLANPATAMLGMALIVSGATMMAMGVINLFMPSPSISKEEDPEASKYIGNGRNTTAIGTVIGIGAGRMLIGGQFMSVQVNSLDMVYGSFPATPT